MKQKKRILVITDSPALTTGFSRVGAEITKALLSTEKYEISTLAWFHPFDSKTEKFMPFEYECPLYFTDPTNMDDKYGHHTGANIIATAKPDYVITVGDHWMIDWVGGHRDLGYKWISYFPIDGAPYPKPWKYVTRMMDIPITFTDFGFQTIKADDPFINVQVIPHGVDNSVFHKLSMNEMDAFKQNTLPELVGKFVVGTMGRNQPRKNYPAIFEAFSKFAKDKEDAVLYCHVAAQDPVGWNLADLVERYDLQKRVILPHMQVCMGVPNEVLSRVYNCFDIAIFPYTREGWALGVVESMACGVPVLYTDYSAPTSFAKGCGEPINVACYVTSTHYNLKDAYVDVDDMVSKMNKLYYNPSLRLQYGTEGQKRAAQLDWKNVGNSWINLFNAIDEGKM